MMHRFITAREKRKSSRSDIVLLELIYIQSVNVNFQLPSALADGYERQKEDGFSHIQFGAKAILRFQIFLPLAEAKYLFSGGRVTLKGLEWNGSPSSVTTLTMREDASRT